MINSDQESLLIRSGVLIGIEAIIDSDSGRDWFGAGVLIDRDWSLDWSGLGAMIDLD